MVLEIAVRMEFSRLTRGLQHCADGNNDSIRDVRLTRGHQHCADGNNDSIRDVHKLCQVLLRYLCISPWGWLLDRGTSVSFTPFLAKFFFYISSFVSIG